MKRRVLSLSIAVIAVVAFAFAGCSMFGNDDTNDGDDDGGDNTTEEETTKVVGTTDYSSDGGVTVEDASFKFEVVDSSKSKGISPRAAENTVPIEGSMRAGDILLQLTGSYNTETGDFTITASGTIGGTTIEVTVKGNYNENTGEITEGNTVVTVSDDNETETYQTENVKSGDSDTNSIEDTSGTEEATATESESWWEGTWVSIIKYYYDENGYQTNEETEYYEEESLRVVATDTQYNFYWKWEYSDALVEHFDIDPSNQSSEEKSVAVIEEVISNNTTDKTLDAYYYYPDNDTYARQYVWQPESGYIWGASYDDNDGDSEYDSLSEAKDNLGSLSEDSVKLETPEGIKGAKKVQ